MKKTYINPVLNVVKLNISNSLLAGSGGMGDEQGTPGNKFTNTDVSYGRGFDFEGDEY